MERIRAGAFVCVALIDACMRRAFDGQHIVALSLP
jgi:hypothetical protein